MEPSCKIVINEEEEEHSNTRGGGRQSDLSSDDEEEEHSNTRGGGRQSDLSSDDEEEEQSNTRGGGSQSDLKKELDGDCVILDGDPGKPLRVVENESGLESDELVIVAEKGQVACRDYPHARHLCARFPFNTNPHEKYCALCHCYVCDMLAPCDHWGRGLSSVDHCHATDKEEIWRALRQCSEKGERAQLHALNHPVDTSSSAPILHPRTGPSRPSSGGKGRGVTVGSMIRALHQLTVQTDRLTGTVTWFSNEKGYGFITPDGGGENLFVHQSSIKFGSLAKGEAVEFRIDREYDGRKQAVDVTGPGDWSKGDVICSDTRKCYNCGQIGHLKRDCSESSDGEWFDDYSD